MRHVTVRNVPADVAEGLEAVSRETGKSLNATVIELLRRALGVGAAPCENGLARFAGGWNDAEFDEFEDATRAFETIDDALWR